VLATLGAVVALACARAPAPPPEEPSPLEPKPRPPPSPPGPDDVPAGADECPSLGTLACDRSARRRHSRYPRTVQNAEELERLLLRSSENEAPLVLARIADEYAAIACIAIRDCLARQLADAGAVSRKEAHAARELVDLARERFAKACARLAAEPDGGSVLAVCAPAAPPDPRDGGAPR